jgi:ribosomal protein S18 acetylase RimI-like enzyme
VIGAAAWHIVSAQAVSLPVFVEALAHGRPWVDPDRIDTWLTQRLLGASSYLAMEGAHPVGIAVAALELAVNPVEVYIDQVVVAADHRRRGLARALVQRCERYGQERGAQRAWLTTAPGNPAAHWWQSMGYSVRESATHLHGWPVQIDLKGPGRHRVVLAKALGPAGS